jgi:hypothetical protein
MPSKQRAYPSRYWKKCRNCGRSREEVGRLSARGLCEPCSYYRMISGILRRMGLENWESEAVRLTLKSLGLSEKDLTEIRFSANS